MQLNLGCGSSKWLNKLNKRRYTCVSSSNVFSMFGIGFNVWEAAQWEWDKCIVESFTSTWSPTSSIKQSSVSSPYVGQQKAFTVLQIIYNYI